jgi:hypothetical protein
MQNQQMQAAMEEQIARTNLAKARATADEGLGYERLSRIEENRALAEERRAAARKDEDMAMLNLIKALKEIDTIDIGQIEKLLALSNIMKSQQKEEERAELEPIGSSQQRASQQPNLQQPQGQEVAQQPQEQLPGVESVMGR